MKKTLRIAAATVVATFALAGCLKTDAEFTIKENNTVDGTIYLATDKEYVDDATPSKTHDADAEAARYTNATVTHYETDRWYGDRIDVASEPLASFTAASDAWEIDLQRAGDQFVVTGPVPDPDDADSQQTIQEEDGSAMLVVHFPGPIQEHNGSLSDANTVRWDMLEMTEAPYARGLAFESEDPEPTVTVVVTPSATPIASAAPSPSASQSVAASPSASPSASTAPASDDGGIPTWVWIAGGVMLALLIALVGVMVGLLASRGKKAPAVAEPEPEAEPVTKELPTQE